MIKITRVSVRPFSIPLGPKPLVVVSGSTVRTFERRIGAYLVLEARQYESTEMCIDAGTAPFVGVGEIVEPVFVVSGAESTPSTVLTDALVVLAELSVLLNNRTLDLSLEHFTASIDSIFSNEVCTPSQARRLARFAVEQAILRLTTEITNSRLPEILGLWMNWPVNRSVESVCINGFLSLRDLTSPMSSSVAKTMSCVKIKVGPVEDAFLINSLVTDFPKSYRVDPNGTWSIPEVSRFISFLNPIARSCLEYLEEPVCSLSLVELKSNVHQLDTICPIGLDESLLIEGVETIIQENDKLHMVYKPFVLGINRKLFFSAERMIFTCSFESGVGTAFLLALAAARDARFAPRHHGIHTWPSMSDPLTMKLNQIYIEEKVSLANLSEYEKALRYEVEKYIN